MNFSLLLPNLPRAQQLQHPQHLLHPDDHAARQRAPASPSRAPSGFAARWHDLRARVFRV
jgi:hypothetical protein